MGPSQDRLTTWWRLAQLDVCTRTVADIFAACNQSIRPSQWQALAASPLSLCEVYAKSYREGVVLNSGENFPTRMLKTKKKIFFKCLERFPTTGSGPGSKLTGWQTRGKSAAFGQVCQKNRSFDSHSQRGVFESSARHAIQLMYKHTQNGDWCSPTLNP